MKIIYDKLNGNIVSAISSDQDFKVYYKGFGDDFVNNLSELKVEYLPEPLSNYYVTNGEILKYGELEISEKEMFGRILSNEDRLLNKLKPSHDEVQKAKNTIEILSLLSEVL